MGMFCVCVHSDMKREVETGTCVDIAFFLLEIVTARHVLPVVLMGHGRKD